MGFGLHRATIGTGAYGPELEEFPRLQGWVRRHHLRRLKLKIHIVNRIARASAAVRIGNIPIEGADEASITHVDSFAPDSPRYKHRRWGGWKIDPPKKEPRASYFCLPTDKQKYSCIACCILTNTGKGGEMRLAEDPTVSRGATRLIYRLFASQLMGRPLVRVFRDCPRLRSYDYPTAA